MAAATAALPPAKASRRWGHQNAWGYFWSFVAWVLAIFLFFPVFWMVLTSFKTEGAAYTYPPRFIFHPTLSEYASVFSGVQSFTKPFELPLLGRIFFTPLNIIEEIAKPLSLALRLFGNIFGGLVMVYLLTLGFTAFAGSSVLQTALSPIWVILLVAWKLFDVFLIGTIQAFIFMLLTIIYFGMAREGLEEEHHGATAHGNKLRRETR